MNKYLKKSLITGASVLMLLSIGVGVPNVNARNKSSVKTKMDYHDRVTKRHKYGVKKKLFPLALKTKHGYQRFYHDPFDESYPSFDYFNVNTFKVLKPIRIERITRKHGQPEIDNYADAYYYVKRGSIIRLQNGASATYFVGHYLDGHRLSINQHGHYYLYTFDSGTGASPSFRLEYANSRIKHDKFVLRTKHSKRNVNIYRNLLKQERKRKKYIRQIKRMTIY